MQELWRPIPGYEELYEVSNKGRVRSVPHLLYTPTGCPYMSKSKIRKPQIVNGRNRISLVKGNKRDTLQLARIIALAWVDGYEEGLTVDHIDGDKLNDDLSNLRWLSRGENTKESYRQVTRSHHIPVELTDDFGNVLRFNCEWEADRFLGRHVGYIDSILRYCRNPRAHSKDGTYYSISMKRGNNNA